jgi:hypothetical protein
MEATVNYSASSSDFNDTISVVYTFGADPEESERIMCAVIPLSRDGIVESEEVFEVSLVGSLQEPDVVIELSEAQVFIVDSPLDGKHLQMERVQLHHDGMHANVIMRRWNFFDQGRAQGNIIW